MTRRNKLSNIVSLDEFRTKIAPPPQTPETFEGFSAANGDTYHAIRHILTRLNGGQPPDQGKVAVAIRDNAPNQPTEVYNVDSVEGKDYFAVGLDPFERRSFTHELTKQPIDIRDRLGESIDIFPVALEVGNCVLRRDSRVHAPGCCEVSSPHIGDAQFKVHKNNIEDMTTWRVASRLAIDGIFPNQPEGRALAEKYLGKILSWEVEHEAGTRTVAWLQGVELPTQTFANSTKFIGACNPINQFELNKVLIRQIADEE